MDKEKQLDPTGEFAPPVWHYLPVDLDPGQLDALGPLLDELDKRELPDLPAYKKWLADFSEFHSRVDGEEAERYVAWAKDTGAEEARARHLEFQQKIKPALRPRLISLSRKLLATAARLSPPGEEQEIIIRQVAAEVGLFRDALVPLEAAESKLETRYGEISGKWTVEFRGKEQTLQQMALFLEEDDRELRAQVWRLTSDRRLADGEKLEEVFDGLLGLRGQMAIAAEKKDYREYAFVHLKRFDYTPDDCLEFHATVESQVLPAVNRIMQTRKDRLGLEELRPWDLAVDPRQRGALRPFADVPEMMDGMDRVLKLVHPRLAGELRYLSAAGLTDLGTRKGKTPGAFCYPLESNRLPFLFANAAGSHRDVKTMLHESGHAFHALAARDRELLALRHSPIEFAEVASMGMELLGIENLAVWYGEKDQVRVLGEQLRDTLVLLPWIATIDAFQHWLYTHPGHDRPAREAAWLATRQRFASNVVDWSGLTTEETCLWHRQPHLFQYPFYYFEYAVAQLGALQLWTRYRQDPEAAVAGYLEALALGGSRKLPDLFAAAGLRFAFDRETVAALVADVVSVLEGAGEITS